MQLLGNRERSRAGVRSSAMASRFPSGFKSQPRSITFRIEFVVDDDDQHVLLIGAMPDCIDDLGDMSLAAQQRRMEISFDQKCCFAQNVLFGNV